MKSPKTIRWGMIGCGNVTEKKSGPAFQKVPNSQLAAVMRRSKDLAKDYASRHNVPKYYTHATDLILDPEIDAIYIATPPDSHAQYAIKAMQAGKPVYIEKPMARTYKECQEIIRVSKETRIPAFVAYYRRYLPGFVKIKELIEKGAIGEPTMVSIQLFRPPFPQDLKSPLPWRLDPKISGGGYFVDLASHQLDYLDFLFGPIRDIQGIASNMAGLYSVEDTVSASFSFDSGIIGSGNWCFCAGEHRDVMEIIGNKGRILFSGFRHEPFILETEKGREKILYQNPEPIQMDLIQAIVSYLNGGPEVQSTAETAARTNWVMEQILNNKI